MKKFWISLFKKTGTKTCNIKSNKRISYKNIWKETLNPKMTPPDKYFNWKCICPFCGISLFKYPYKFSDVSIPYIRFRNEFYWCHIECMIIVYKGFKYSLDQHPDEVMVNNL